MLDKTLLEILVCPKTGLPLTYDEENQRLVCEEAGLAYPVREGVPLLLLSEATKV